jgi:AraC-like DNA-binding protein
MLSALVWCLIAVFQVAASEGKEVTALLSRFKTGEGQERLQAANRLMETYHQEELTDGLLCFDDRTHPDTLCQQVWYWTAEHYYASGNYHDALQYGELALPLCEGTDVEANCLNLLALGYFRTTQYEAAAEYAKRCYRIDEQSGDPDLMSSSLNTIAGIYIGANQPYEAEKYILKGLEMAHKADNPARMAVLLGMASEVYHAQGDDEKAIQYIDQACEVERKLGRTDRLMVRLAQKASVLIGRHDYADAEQVLSEVIPYFRQTQNVQSLGIACNKMGMALLSQERPLEAIPYYREAADLFVRMGDKHNEMHARKGLYESFWSQYPDSAKMELDRFNDLKDTLYNQATAESLARYNAEFGSDWLQQENEIQRARTRIAILCGIGGMLLLAVLVWIYMHRRMKLREAALNTIIRQLRDAAGHAEDVKEEVVADLQEEKLLSRSDKEFLNKVVTFVIKRVGQSDASIESLASDMCITRGYLNRKLKTITGMTAQQYVQRIRMEQARLILESRTEVTVVDLAMQCGFEDSTSFTRAFRRVFGKTPSQYREDCA